MNRQIATVVARDVVPAAFGLALFVASALVDLGVWGVALIAAVLAMLWFVERPPRLGVSVPGRVLLAATATVLAARNASASDRWQLALSAVLLIGPMLVETMLRRIAGPWSVVARLPSPWHWTMTVTRNGAAWLVSSVLTVVLGLFGVLELPMWPVLLSTLAGAGFAGALFVSGWSRRRDRHRDEMAALRGAVERHAPKFLFYFSAPPGSEYQVRMWMPYLERLGEPFLVVTPEAVHLPAILSTTTAPVVVYRALDALDTVLVDSVRAVFYVNNGMKNTQCVRYTHVTHVQLYHADSDKAVTANPVNAMYDRIFVAGQAAIDRFATHGVSIPAEKFRIVGRPQVAAVEQARQPIGSVEGPAVLYAPTWRGAYADTNHCSLLIGRPIIEALLGRGATVIVRPHPYVRQDRGSAALLDELELLLARDRERTGRPHRWGAETSDRLTLAECMNLSDAMICDVSSVASEYLFSGKPFAVTDMSTVDAPLARATPLASANYVIDADLGNLGTVLDDLLGADPLADERRRMRTYYLGDHPAEAYADGFLIEARRCLTGAARADAST